MASFLQRVTGRADLEERDSFPLPFQDWVNWFQYGNTAYPFLTYSGQNIYNDQERPVPADFVGIAAQVYRSNAVIFALCSVRQDHFSEVRFQYRQLRGGRPGDLFGTSDLAILEQPWPNGTTGDLLSRMIQDADLAGNSYVVRQGDRLARLRPDWMSILLGSRTKRESWIPGDADTEPIAYIYHPGGATSREDPIVYQPSEIAHFAPRPDPLGIYRGMSWITPVIREVLSDSSAVAHKLKFFENGATVNMVVKIPTENLELFDKIVAKYNEGHQGLANVYKTLFLAAGGDATPVGLNFQQMDFKVLQAAGETRMAAAAGVPPIIVGFSEGLSGSSLNAGNYATSRRRFADGTIRILWRQVCGALSTIVPVPANAELWYDDRDIAFLQEDSKDRADVQQTQATTAKTFIDAGFEPDAVIEAIAADDINRLSGKHTGLTSVQLQPPALGEQIGGDPFDAAPVPDSPNDGSPTVPAQSGTQNGNQGGT